MTKHTIELVNQVSKIVVNIPGGLAGGQETYVGVPVLDEEESHNRGEDVVRLDEMGLIFVALLVSDRTVFINPRDIITLEARSLWRQTIVRTNPHFESPRIDYILTQNIPRMPAPAPQAPKTPPMSQPQAPRMQSTQPMMRTASDRLILGLGVASALASLATV